MVGSIFGCLIYGNCHFWEAPIGGAMSEQEAHDMSLAPKYSVHLSRNRRQQMH